MAQINFNDIAQPSERSGAGNKPQINFFNLKSGEESIVRFMHDTPQDLDILSMHEINVNGNTRKISCNKGPNYSGHCALCESNQTFVDRFGNEKKVNQIVNKAYIKMLVYTTNPDNTISATPMIWERSLAVARELVGYMNDYGPLSDIICKIKRVGTGLDTQYTISPNLNKMVYTDEKYVKDASAFENYSALGRIVLNKTDAEIMHFFETGNFDNEEAAFENAAPVVPETVPTQAAPVQPQQNTGFFQQPTAQTFAGQFAQQEAMPWDTPAQTAPQQPVRYY